ncbi:SDR family oxidoreductase [Actinomadura algeriensis]|uniref:NAD(P)-dependent dehydrogenase (Short-subunit alcohol dehydrogenase family) n=1 Tax=Actinomadura algeriensis TaxID=1679523 RepID=A0ABR9JYH4_9ACTN|nr:SDR family oxidoreductase [Actinomadura algeriensis]MBE1535629.1 NAD(P)-dependent dehydrogenase (short-subunit alcohol dehydrogenase family) [Actinomadura algeriensis]
MTNDERFAGKVALITGGTSGMGLAVARRLLAEGARVVVTGRDQGRLDAAAKGLDGAGPGADGRVLAVRADAGSLPDLDALMDTVRDRLGRLDVVFANAGTGTFGPAADITEADFDHSVNVNFKGVYFTIQKALPLLADDASIVINASWTLHRGLPIASLYSATKAAVQSLARTLAAELGPRGVRVNSVSPGYIDTPMFRGAVPADEVEGNRAQVASGRIGTPEEVAGAVAFLASADAAYVNGQDLIVDGGLVAAVA